MRRHVIPLAICSVLASPTIATPQEWHYYAAMRGNCQQTQGGEATLDGTIGATFIQVPSCNPSSIFVTSVQPGGPAATAGIEVGDTLFRVVQQGTDIYSIPLIACELDEEIRNSNGRSISLVRMPRNSSNASPVTVQVKSRANVYPEEATRPPSISQMIEVGMRGPAETKEGKTPDGKTITFQECPPPKRVDVSVTQVSQWPGTPIHVELLITNETRAVLALNENKVFLLDANHRQIQHVTYQERRFQIENTRYELQKLLHRLDEFTQPGTFTIAQPAPPAPPVRYSIDVVTDGTYMVSPIGINAVNVSGTSTTSFTLKPEFDSSQSLAYFASSISYLIERRRVERWNKEMQAKWEDLRRGVEDDIRKSNQLLENWKRVGLDFSGPLAPNEIRSGYALFSPSAANGTTSLSLILVLTDPDSQKDQFVIFRFHQ